MSAPSKGATERLNLSAAIDLHSWHVIDANAFGRCAANWGHGKLGSILRPVKQTIRLPGFAKVVGLAVQKQRIPMALFSWPEHHHMIPGSVMDK
jgi:hypothetical protein